MFWNISCAHRKRAYSPEVVQYITRLAKTLHIVILQVKTHPLRTPFAPWVGSPWAQSYHTYHMNHPVLSNRVKRNHKESSCHCHSLRSYSAYAFNHHSSYNVSIYSQCYPWCTPTGTYTYKVRWHTTLESGGSNESFRWTANWPCHPDWECRPGVLLPTWRSGSVVCYSGRHSTWIESSVRVSQHP